MKLKIIYCAALLLLLLPTSHIAAAKVRVRKAKVGTVSYSTAKLSRPTNSVIVTFQNLGSVKRISYELTYLAGGTSQGAMGTVQTTGLVSDTRDLYFGTCSKGVCTPHTSVTNATLKVTSSLTNGATNVKLYRIKL